MNLPAKLIEGLHPERLVAMLACKPADEVLHAIDGWLGQAEPTIADLATLDVLIQQAEAQAANEREATLRLGLAGKRCEAVHRAERKLAEIKVALWQRIGKFVDSLPEDPGGRIGEGEPEPLRRQARRELGVDRGQLAGLVELGRADQGDVDAYREKIRKGQPVPKSPAAAARAVVRTVYGSGEAYTPPPLLRACRRALGVDAFGEDPSSNWAAQTCLVKAERWRCLGRPEWGKREEDYARVFETPREDFDDELARYFDEDGLGPTEWLPNWLLNPDYASGVVKGFAERAHAEAMAGRPGILLVNAATSADWQQLLLEHWPCCWLGKRVAFYSPTGEELRGNQWSSVVFGLGVEVERFAHAMAEWGAVRLPFAIESSETKG